MTITKHDALTSEKKYVKCLYECIHRKIASSYSKLVEFFTDFFACQNEPVKSRELNLFTRKAPTDG